MARQRREQLETIEEELEEVKRRLGRIWNVIETTDIEMADASERIREHRERKEKLEIAAEEARGLLAERRQFLDSADTIAAFAAEMSEFLKTSELTETKAFVNSFIKEIEVKPGKAAIVYSIPMLEDSPIGGANAAEVALNGGVRSTVRHGTPARTRTGAHGLGNRCSIRLSYRGTLCHRGIRRVDAGGLGPVDRVSVRRSGPHHTGSSVGGSMGPSRQDYPDDRVFM